MYLENGAFNLEHPFIAFARTRAIYERPKILASEERLTSAIAFPSRHAKTALAVSKTISLVVNDPLRISSDIS